MTVPRHKNHQRRYLLFVVFILSLLSPRTATACGRCVFALVDWVFPPVYLWCILAIVWFLVTAGVAAIRHQKLLGIPKFFRACLLVITFILLGVVIGPFLVLSLIAPCIFSFLSSFSLQQKSRWGSKLVGEIRIIGSIGIISILALGSYKVYILRNRGEVDYMVKWSDTAPVRSRFKELRENEPKGLYTYRKLIERVPSSLVGLLAVERIAVIGEPEVDVPILINSLSRVRKELNTVWKNSGLSIEKALRSLSGLDLPNNSSADI